MSNYRYAAVVQLTMDDPVNEDRNEGDVMLVAGKNADGYSYTVIDEDTEGFVDVECEVLGTIEAPERMTENGIRAWAANQPEARELAEAAT